MRFIKKIPVTIHPHTSKDVRVKIGSLTDAQPILNKPTNTPLKSYSAVASS